MSNSLNLTLRQQELVKDENGDRTECVKHFETTPARY